MVDDLGNGPFQEREPFDHLLALLRVSLDLCVLAGRERPRFFDQSLREGEHPEVMKERAELEDEKLLLRKSHPLADCLRDIRDPPGPPAGLGIPPFQGLDDHRDGVEVRPVEQPVLLLEVRNEQRIGVTQPGAQLSHDPKCKQGSLVQESFEVAARDLQDRGGFEGARGCRAGSFIKEGHFSEKIAVALDRQNELLAVLQLLRDLDLPSGDDEEPVCLGKLFYDHRPFSVVFHRDDLSNLAEVGFRYF